MDLPRVWQKPLEEDGSFSINRDRFRELAMDARDRGQCPTIEAEDALIRERADREGVTVSTDAEFIHLRKR
jgi:hypothetical protein